MLNAAHYPLKIEAIVATDSQGAIGRAGQLPWSLPSDLKRFKRITLGCPVLMGTATAVSIGMTLPGRLNFVLTRTGTTPYEKQVPVVSMESAIRLTKSLFMSREIDPEDAKLFVIGGEAVYREALPYLTGLHLTTVQTEVEDADRFFPVREFYDMHVRTGRVVQVKSHTPDHPENGLRHSYAQYVIRPEGAFPGVTTGARADTIWSHMDDHLSR